MDQLIGAILKLSRLTRAEMQLQPAPGRALAAGKRCYQLRDGVRTVVALFHRPSDGKTVRVSISAAPIRSPASKPRGAAIIFTDITPLGERKGAAGQQVQANDHR